MTVFIPQNAPIDNNQVIQACTELWERMRDDAVIYANADETDDQEPEHFADYWIHTRVVRFDIGDIPLDPNLNTLAIEAFNQKITPWSYIAQNTGKNDLVQVLVVWLTNDGVWVCEWWVLAVSIAEGETDLGNKVYAKGFKYSVGHEWGHAIELSNAPDATAKESLWHQRATTSQCVDDEWYNFAYVWLSSDVPNSTFYTLWSNSWSFFASLSRSNGWKYPLYSNIPQWDDPAAATYHWVTAADENNQLQWMIAKKELQYQRYWSDMTTAVDIQDQWETKTYPNPVRAGENIYIELWDISADDVIQVYTWDMTWTEVNQPFERVFWNSWSSSKIQITAPKTPWVHWLHIRTTAWTMQQKIIVQ